MWSYVNIFTVDDSEIQQLRSKFASMHDIVKWLEEYPELTWSEHAAITGKSSRSLYRIKRKSGNNSTYIVETSSGTIKKKWDAPSGHHTKFCRALPIPDIPVPSNWSRNRRWLEKCKNEHNMGYMRIAKLIGCNKTKVEDAMRRLGMWGPDKFDVHKFVEDLLNET